MKLSEEYFNKTAKYESYRAKLNSLLKLYLMIKNGHIKTPFNIMLYGFGDTIIRSVAHLQGRIDELCDLLGIAQVNVDGILNKDEINAIKKEIKKV